MSPTPPPTAPPIITGNISSVVAVCAVVSISSEVVVSSPVIVVGLSVASPVTGPVTDSVVF